MAEQNIHYRDLGTFADLLFTSILSTNNSFYEFTQVTTHSMIETMEHRMIRSKCLLATGGGCDVKVKDEIDVEFLPTSDALMAAPPPSTTTSVRHVARSSAAAALQAEALTVAAASAALLPEHHHIPWPPRRKQCEPTSLPRWLFGLEPKISCNGRHL